MSLDLFSDEEVEQIRKQQGFLPKYFFQLKAALNAAVEMKIGEPVRYTVCKRGEFGNVMYSSLECATNELDYSSKPHPHHKTLAYDEVVPLYRLNTTKE